MTDQPIRARVGRDVCLWHRVKLISERYKADYFFFTLQLYGLREGEAEKV